MRVLVVGDTGLGSSQVERAFRSRGVETLVVPPRGFAVCVHREQVTYRAIDLSRFDAAVVVSLPHDNPETMRFQLRMLGFLEAKGVAVVSSPAALALASDACRASWSLASVGIAVPRALWTDDDDHAVAFVEAFGVSLFEERHECGGAAAAVLSDEGQARAFLSRRNRGGRTNPYVVRRVPKHDAPNVVCHLAGGRIVCVEGGIDPGACGVAERALRVLGLDSGRVDLTLDEDKPVVTAVSPWVAYDRILGLAGVDAGEVRAAAILAQAGERFVAPTRAEAEPAVSVEVGVG